MHGDAANDPRGRQRRSAVLEHEARRRGLSLARVLRGRRTGGRSTPRACTPAARCGAGRRHRDPPDCARRACSGPPRHALVVALVSTPVPIVALLDTADPEHERCVQLVERTARGPVVPARCRSRSTTGCSSCTAPRSGSCSWRRRARRLPAAPPRRDRACTSRRARADLRHARPRARRCRGRGDLRAARRDEAATLDRRDFSAVSPVTPRPAHPAGVSRT